MYKYHFKRWKFRKNMTQREAQKHEADAVAGRGVVLPFAHGRELGSQRLKMRIMKLNSPDIFNPPELALRNVLEHSRERLKSWDLPNYQSGNTATESWAHEACLAGLAIFEGKEARSNYHVLDSSARKFSSILQNQEPTLLDFLNQEIGTTNPFVIKYIKSSAKYLHDRKLLTPYDAHKQIDSIISALRFKLDSGSSTSASTQNSLISAYLFKACIYLDCKEWDLVEQILGGIEPEIVDGFGIDPAQVVNCYEIKAEMLMERGNRADYGLAEKYYGMALTRAQQSLAETLPGRTGYILMALEKFYKRVGNKVKLEQAQAQYNEHVKEMAGDVDDQLSFAELAISKSEQEESFDLESVRDTPAC
ncbi:hypothetical protein E8E14_009076 [Neopestalotiopsis sp. 37M]|nr:hypothetical protein E8E14_009076 [Neopestalotiopsis sp. 37M]